jgi:hypothetical protein
MKIIKPALAIVVLCAIAAVCIKAEWGHIYPHGRKPGVLRLMDGTLWQYAHEHDGWFPRSEKGPYAALTLLYPYSDAWTLCGLSGKSQALQDALTQGRDIDESLTSWRYVQGLRTNDPPNLAILWESEAGISDDGRRNGYGSRAVLFLNGGITNIPNSEWDRFIDDQASLRKRTLSWMNWGKGVTN